jgi:uncharacterized protein (DUF3820 family)
MMDAQTRQFLEVVDCEPAEVLDTAERLPGLKAAVKGASGITVYFGKHKGLMLGQVPSSYLRWALSVGEPSRSFRRFQRQAQTELQARGEPQKTKGRKKRRKRRRR